MYIPPTGNKADDDAATRLYQLDIQYNNEQSTPWMNSLLQFLKQRSQNAYASAADRDIYKDVDPGMYDVLMGFGESNAQTAQARSKTAQQQQAQFNTDREFYAKYLGGR